jgi:hypothetical protein
MRYRLPIVALAGAALAFSATTARSERADEAAIRATLERYFSGKADTMAAAFAPGANMIYVRDSLIVVPIPEFIERIRTQEKAAADKPARKDNSVKRIATVDIAGNAAIARLETERGDRLVVDYMTLLNIRGEWLIVNKSFDMVPLKKAS